MRETYRILGTWGYLFSSVPAEWRIWTSTTDFWWWICSDIPFKEVLEKSSCIFFWGLCRISFFQDGDNKMEFPQLLQNHSHQKTYGWYHRRVCPVLIIKAVVMTCSKHSIDMKEASQLYADMVSAVILQALIHWESKKNPMWDRSFLILALPLMQSSHKYWWTKCPCSEYPSFLLESTTTCPY